MARIKPSPGTLLDPGHPLTRGLLAAPVWAEAGRLYDPTGQQWAPVNGPATIAGRTGQAIAFSGNQRLQNTTIYLPTTSATVLLVARPNNSGDTGSAFGGNYPSEPELQCHLPWGGSIYWDFGGNASPARLAWTPDPSFFGQWHALALRAGTLGMSIWSDGVRQAVSATAVIRGTYGPGLDLGAWNSYYQTIDIESFFLFNRELTDDEIRDWTADPYGMFARPSVLRHIPLRQAVALTGAATWNVRQNVYINVSNSWNIRSAVGTSGLSLWDVRNPVGTSGLSLWDVRNPVGLIGDLFWDVYVVTAPTSYPVGIAGDAAWNVLNSVYVNGAASWDNRISEGLAGSAIWANMIPVGIAGDTTWGVRTPSRIAGNALWHVRGRVGGEWSDRWNNRVLASLERSADWSLRGLAGLAGSASWDITSLLAHWPVGLVGSLVWGDRRRLGFSGMVTWNDRLPRGLTRNVVFNIHIKSGKNSTVNFHTRSRLGTTWVATWADRVASRFAGQDRWNVRGLARLSAADRWSTRSPARLDRSVSWNIRKNISMSLSGTWRDRTRVAMAGACVWDLRARVGSNQHIYWNIRNPVRLTAEASWDLRDVVGVDGDVIFMTFLATRPGGVDFDPAAAAAYVEAQHGLNPWGVIPAAGSVRIDHDYPTPDAMRATRGLGTEGIPGVVIRIFSTYDYRSGRRRDPADVRGRSLTGHDGRWLAPIYLIPGDYCILYEESMRPPVLDYLDVVPTPGREPPPPPAGDINNPYYEMDYYLTMTHGWGAWGPGAGIPGPSPVDHDYGIPDQYTFTRNGVGLAGVIVAIYPQADYLAGRTGDRYRVGWSRTNAAGKWDWPVNLYPGLYTAQGWRDGIPVTFTIEVT